MFHQHLQYFEMFLKCVKSAHFNEIWLQYFYKSIEYLFIYKNISES